MAERTLPDLAKRSTAEFLGTFVLVFGGCGAAVMSAANPALSIGTLGISLAFGLAVLTMCYAIGHISGCHLNPAITFGLVVARRFPKEELAAYTVAQCAGAICAAGVLRLIALGQIGWDANSSFATNGFRAQSPGHYEPLACFVMEVVLTFLFVTIVLGATDKRAPQWGAPIAIGFGLTLVHLIGIPVTGVSVNPARSLGPAVFAGGKAIRQLWMFWVAPPVGAAVAALLYSYLAREDTRE